MQKWLILPTCLVAMSAVVWEAQADELKVQPEASAEAVQMTRQGEDGNHQRSPLVGHALVAEDPQIRELQYRVHVMASGFHDLQNAGFGNDGPSATAPSESLRLKKAGWEQTSWIESGVTQLPARRKKTSLGEIQAAFSQPGSTPATVQSEPIARLETPPELAPLPAGAGAELRQALQATPSSLKSQDASSTRSQVTRSGSTKAQNRSKSNAPSSNSTASDRPVVVANVPTLEGKNVGKAAGTADPDELRSVRMRAQQLERVTRTPELVGVRAESLDHPRMQRSLNDAEAWYQGRAKSVARVALTRKAQLRTSVVPALSSVAAPSWVLGVAAVESAMNPNARVGSTYVGMWQLSQDSGRGNGLVVRSGRDERLDPAASSKAAGKMLVWLYKRYSDWPLALAAYNVGHGRVDRALKARPGADLGELVDAGLIPAPCLTNVARYLTMGSILEFPERYGFDNPFVDEDGNRRNPVAIAP